MSVSFNATGKRVTRFAKPTTTAASTIYTAPAGVVSATLEGVVIASGATGDSATVIINDGSTDWHLLSAEAITANTTETYEFANPVLGPGHAVKVVAGAGNILTFTVTVAEQYPIK